MALQTRDLGAALGTEVLGIDLSEPLSDAQFEDIRQLVSRRGVLVFRDQQLAPARQVEFSKRLGPLKVPPLVDHWVLEGHPEVMRISNIVVDGHHIGNPDAGVLWHSDGAYQPVPSMYTLLHCLEIPRGADGRTLGNTLFASTAAAWDALPADRQRQLLGLRARHSLAWEYEQKAASGLMKREQMSDADRHHKVPEVVHPLVRTHPLTGQQCLYLSEGVTIGIEGMDDAAARALIAELNAWASSERFVYRHEWQVGDFVFWDNCPTKHRALFDYDLPQRRLMHRTTVAGSAPF